MEPRPWLEDGATEMERELVRAGRAELPPVGSDQRILAAIQGSAAPTVKPPGLTRWAKIGLLAVVAGGSAVVAHRLSLPSLVPPSSGPSATVSAEGRVPGPMPIPPLVGEHLDAAQEKPPLPLVDEGNAGGKRTIAGNRVRKVPAQLADSPVDRSLGEETKALDRVREALDSHRTSEGLRLLDEYRVRFPQGLLRPESMVLRLTALLQAGRHQAAQVLANQLLSDETYAAYVPRIQSLLREAKP
jgi:hypothetical protein